MISASLAERKRVLRMFSVPYIPLVGLLLGILVIPRGGLIAQGNAFTVHFDAQQIRLVALTDKPVYELRLELRYAHPPSVHIQGPAFLAPRAVWEGAYPPSQDPDQELTIAFCDESGILSTVFATLGYPHAPPLTLSRDALRHRLTDFLDPSWSSVRLFWRDVRDLVSSAEASQCQHVPPLRMHTLEGGHRSAVSVDAEPISAVLQVLAEDEHGQPVARILTLADPVPVDALPAWVRCPLPAYGIGLTLVGFALWRGSGHGRRFCSQ